MLTWNVRSHLHDPRRRPERIYSPSSLARDDGHRFSANELIQPMRRAIGTLVVSQVVAIAVVLAAPSAAFAEPAPFRLDQSSVPAAATRARRPFDGEALRRAVETAVRSPASPDKQAPPVAAGRDSLWNGVLFGAGIGAVAGGPVCGVG
jgi:hypothetical protein